MLFANSNFKDLLVEGALFDSGIAIQCVSEHVWVGHGGFRGQGGELPAGGIRASQGTFSSSKYDDKADFYSQCDYNICKYVFMSGCGIDLHYENLPMQYI